MDNDAATDTVIQQHYYEF